MEYISAHTQSKQIRDFNNRYSKAYDYANGGILSKILPPVVYNATNPVTHHIIMKIDDLAIWLLKYVDELRYFKDWFHKDH